MRKLTFLKLSRVFFSLFVLFLPFQIDALLFSSGIYENGFMNIYKTHFLYINDLFLLLTLFFLGLSFIFNKVDFKVNWKDFFPVFIFLMVILFSLFFSIDRLNSLFVFIRFLEFFAVFFIISIKLIDFKKLLYIFVFVNVFVAIIGILQYVFQHSVGLQFLGEPVISNDMVGVAKVKIFDNEILRAYGTFSHPNLFAAYLLFSIFFIFHLLQNGSKRKILFVTLIICFVALILTFSRSAYLAFLTGILFYFGLSKVKISFKYVVLIFALLSLFVFVFKLSDILSHRIFIDNSGFTERFKLLSISKEMFFAHPFGVGLGNFTSEMQNFTQFKLMPWEFQPVHNLFLLIVNETGIQGVLAFLLLFVYFFVKIVRNPKTRSLMMTLWFVFFVLALFDHYFWSFYRGEILMWMLFGLIGSKKFALV